MEPLKPEVIARLEALSSSLNPEQQNRLRTILQEELGRPLLISEESRLGVKTGGGYEHEVTPPEIYAGLSILAGGGLASGRPLLRLAESAGGYLGAEAGSIVGEAFDHPILGAIVGGIAGASPAAIVSRRSNALARKLAQEADASYAQSVQGLIDADEAEKAFMAKTHTIEPGSTFDAKRALPPPEAVSAPITNPTPFPVHSGKVSPGAVMRPSQQGGVVVGGPHGQAQHLPPSWQDQLNDIIAGKKVEVISDKDRALMMGQQTGPSMVGGMVKNPASGKQMQIGPAKWQEPEFLDVSDEFLSKKNTREVINRMEEENTRKLQDHLKQLEKKNKELKRVKKGIPKIVKPGTSNTAHIDQQMKQAADMEDLTVAKGPMFLP